MEAGMSGEDGSERMGQDDVKAHVSVYVCGIER